MIKKIFGFDLNFKFSFKNLFLIFAVLIFGEFGWGAGKATCPPGIGTGIILFCGHSMDENAKGCVSIDTARGDSDKVRSDRAIAQCQAEGYPVQSVMRLAHQFYHLQNVGSNVYLCSVAKKRADICLNGWPGLKYNKNTGVCSSIADPKLTCSDGSNQGPEDLKAKVVEPVATPAPVAAATSSDTTPPVAAADNLDCLNNFIDASVACFDQGNEAATSCDPNNADTQKTDYLAQSKQAIDLIAQGMQAKGKFLGAADICLRSGLLSATGHHAYDLLASACSDKQVQCEKTCGTANDLYEKIKNNEVCTDNKKAQERAAELYAEYTKSKEACTVTAPENEKKINALLVELNQAGKDSAKCNCQLTVGGAANYNIPTGTGGTANGLCNNVQGPADCAANPLAIGCSVAAPLAGGCAGANAQTKLCLCAMNPSSTSCAAAATGPSQMAGAFNPLAPSTANFSGSGVGGANSKLDLTMPTDAAGALSGDKTASTGADSLFGSANGGGPGGGPSGGSGSDSGGGSPAAADATESKSLLGGLFNNAKTGFANLFGGSKNSALGKNFGDKNKNGSGPIDPNVWRPVGLRGIAGSSSGVGSKNMDIFKMINNQYNDQYHTLMTIPEPKSK